MSLLADYRTETELLGELRQSKISGVNSVRTLRNWRTRRTGPPFVRLGRNVLYPIDGFAAWLKSQIQEPVRSRKRAA
jgi:hypothetical protein